MGVLTGLWLALLGVLGASRLIIARKPNAKELIEKAAPYQGWIGAISALWGAWWIVSAVLDLRVLSFAPLAWLLWLLSGVVMLLLGFLLGVGVMKSFVKDDKANEKADALIHKLSPYQGRLGIVAIVLGCITLVRALGH